MSEASEAILEGLRLALLECEQTVIQQAAEIERLRQEIERKVTLQ